MAKELPKKLYITERTEKTVDKEELQIIVVDRSENKDFTRIIFK